MGRPTNTEARRAEIVQALTVVMAERGYERATVAAVAKEAGLAPGLVHYHFANKAEILQALVTSMTDAARTRIEMRLGVAESALGRIDAVVDALLDRGDGADTSAAACWALVGAEAVTTPEVRELYATFIAELAERLRYLLVAACHEAGRSGEGSKAMAGAVVATIEGYFALGAAIPEVIPRGSAASMTRHMVRGLVGGQPRKESR